MNPQAKTTRMPDLRPVVAFTVALVAGSVGGYFAYGALEPQPAQPQYETLEFVPQSSPAAFPNAFANRDDAIAWLQRQIAFLDRNASFSQRPVVDWMKAQLAILEQRPAERIERALLEYVREESELLCGDLAGVSSAAPQRARVRLPRIDD